MRFATPNSLSLLMSLQDAGAIDTGGGAPAPPMERITDTPSGPDSASNIMSDLRQSFEAPEPAPVATPAIDPPQAPTAPLTEPVKEVAPVEAAPQVVAPEVTPETITEPPAPESHLAPLFSLATLPAEEALPKAIDIIRGLAERTDPTTGQRVPGYDPIVHKLLVNATFQSAPNTFRNWVLGDMGIEPAKVDQFIGWLKNGGPEAPKLDAFPRA